MKKLYTILVLMFAVSLANATIHQITVANFSFTPSAINAVCGDTVAWVWSSGTHTTTSTSVPNCATSWNAPMTSSSPAYAIIVPCAGTYSYQCNMHPSTMQGTIVVACSNAVGSINNNFASSAYPVPFSNKLTIEADADMIALYNMVGEKIKTITLPHGQTKTEINAADLRDGIYFYCIIKEGVLIETRKIVKN